MGGPEVNVHYSYENVVVMRQFVELIPWRPAES